MNNFTQRIENMHGSYAVELSDAMALAGEGFGDIIACDLNGLASVIWTENHIYTFHECHCCNMYCVVVERHPPIDAKRGDEV